MNTPNGAAHRSARPWTRRSIAVLGGLFIAMIVAMAALDIARGYRAALDESAHDLDTRARILAEQTARSLQAIDVVMRHLAQRLEGTQPLRAQSDALHMLLRDQAVGLVQTHGLAIHDADGIAIATTWVHPPPESANISDRSFFREVRDGNRTGLYVGRTLRSRIDGHWFFPVGRVIGDPQSSFAGTVGARGNVEYFQAFYRDAEPEPGTQIALIHRDGTLVAGYPVDEAALGKAFPMFDEWIASQERGAGEPMRDSKGPAGAERLGTARLVSGYPLAVVVSRDTASALAPWRAQAVGTAARTVTLGALALLLLWLLMRKLSEVSAARDALEATRQRFALAVAGSDDGIWDWDLVSQRIFASARAHELLGLPKSEEVQSKDELFKAVRLHPDDAAKRDAALEAHFAGRTPAYEGEYRVCHADGSYRWIHVRGLCVRDETGRPLRIAGSISDIDSRKRAEQALRQSEERYAIAMIGMNVAHWVWDVRSDDVFASKNLGGMVGLAPEEVPTKGRDWMKVVPLHPDDRYLLRNAVDEHLAGRTPRIDVEYRVLDRSTERYRWIHTRGQCFRDDDGRPERVAGATLDVSERKQIQEALRQSEQALRESEERYQLAVDGANEGLWDWELASDLLFLSPRAQEILWIEPGEPRRPRREWIELTNYHPDDIVGVRDAIAAHLHGTTHHFDVEYRLRHHDGSWHWYRQHGIALRDAQGRAYRMAGSMEDISDRKNAEADRDRLERQLRQSQKLEAMGTLAGGIAHDFNNILAAILGYGDMAQKEAPEGTALRRHIDATISAGMRAKSLVERILAFSRSGMGERRPVHVQTIVAEVLGQVGASLPSGIRLERALHAPAAAVLGDPTQIHQVVMNLCANAVQAIGARGTIRVSVEATELEEARCVTTSQLAAGSYVRLVVRDTGVGIAARVLDRIFDPFYTTREVGVGTGLGLSLVHGIVTDLGGGIDVESTPGEGTSMTVYLPRDDAAAAAPQALDEAPAELGNGQTILLVDDEVALVRLGEEMLAQLGYEPVGFSSSTQALETFRETPGRFDLVLSDEAMPGMTGSELVQAIRAIRPDIPVLLMSGYVSPALSARVRELGVVDVLAKPLASREIARGVARALRETEAAAEHLPPAA